MIDVRELERRWLRYKIKKYLPYGALLVSILVILFVTLRISSLDKRESQTDISQQKKGTPAPQKEPKPTVTPPSMPQVSKEPVKNKPSSPTVKQTLHPKTTPMQPIQQDEKIANKAATTISREIEPSMDFLRKMKDNSVLPQSQPLLPQQQNRLDEPLNGVAVQNNSLKKENQGDLHSTNQKRAKIKIRIKKTSKKDLQTVIERFKKSNNPVLGLFIAKKYYAMGEYHKAYNYALITNQIDSTIEESWLVFAKSLVKLGQKERAIKTLRAYIKTSKSNKAQLLLQNILTGKFQ